MHKNWSITSWLLETCYYPRQHCRLSSCGHFGWVWQILSLSEANLNTNWWGDEQACVVYSIPSADDYFKKRGRDRANVIIIYILCHNKQTNAPILIWRSAPPFLAVRKKNCLLAEDEVRVGLVSSSLFSRELAPVTSVGVLFVEAFEQGFGWVCSVQSCKHRWINFAKLSSFFFKHSGHNYFGVADYHTITSLLWLPVWCRIMPPKSILFVCLWSLTFALMGSQSIGDGPIRHQSGLDHGSTPFTGPEFWHPGSPVCLFVIPWFIHHIRHRKPPIWGLFIPMCGAETRVG